MAIDLKVILKAYNLHKLIVFFFLLLSPPNLCFNCALLLVLSPLRSHPHSLEESAAVFIITGLFHDMSWLFFPLCMLLWLKACTKWLDVILICIDNQLSNFDLDAFSVSLLFFSSVWHRMHTDSWWCACRWTVWTSSGHTTAPLISSLSSAPHTIDTAAPPAGQGLVSHYKSRGYISENSSKS